MNFNVNDSSITEINENFVLTRVKLIGISKIIKMDAPLAIRKLIIEKFHQNTSQVTISRQLNISTSSVNNIITHYRRTGQIEATRAGRCGRKRIFTTRDERMLARASTKHPQTTARQLQQMVGGSVATASKSTVCRSLNRSGKMAYRPCKAPLLTKKQMKTRLKWARDHESWSIDMWKKVRWFGNSKEKF